MKDIKTEKGKKINKKSLIVALDVAQEKHVVYMRSKEVKVVQVNPMHTKRGKELRGNSQNKTDEKDPQVIEDIIELGNYLIFKMRPFLLPLMSRNMGCVPHFPHEEEHGYRQDLSPCPTVKEITEEDKGAAYHSDTQMYDARANERTSVMSAL